MSPLKVSRSHSNNRFVASRSRNIVESAPCPYSLSRNSRVTIPAVDQILGEYRSSDKSLRTRTIQVRRYEIALKCSEVGQKLPINTVPAIDIERMTPELAGLHGEPAGESIESVELAVDPVERVQQVFGSVSGLSWPAETVVDRDFLG